MKKFERSSKEEQPQDEFSQHKQAIESFGEQHENDFFVDSAQYLISQMADVAYMRDNAKNPEARGDLEEILDNARVLMGNLLVQMCGAFDQLRAEGRVPERAWKEVANKLAELGKVLAEADKVEEKRAA